jgi:23S rRNA (adenine2503-C2)-methyltransferase
MSAMWNPEIHETHTGKIFTAFNAMGFPIEYLYVADYGKNKNIKASFLGLDTDINGVRGSLMPLEEKIVVTISTQHGCSMKCRFCDVPLVGKGPNISEEEILEEISSALYYSMIKKTKRLNVHFARMGEPSFNGAVISAVEQLPRLIDSIGIKVDTIHPVISTMMPKSNSNLLKFLNRWCILKNQQYEGNAGLQISVNSTCEKQREFLFDGKACGLKEIARMAGILPPPLGRKYCLNFCITKDTKIDAEYLASLFDTKKFMCKLTPIHSTTTSSLNSIQSKEGYSSFDMYRRPEECLKTAGFDVIVFVPSEEEEISKITCGNAILSNRIKGVSICQ